VLPFLEQNDAYNQQVYQVAVKVYMCPARGRLNPQTVPSEDPVWEAWTYDNGGVNPWGKTDYAGNVNVFLGNLALDDDPNGTKLTGQTERIAGITDGTSHTLLAGDKSLDPMAYNTGGWFWDEPIFAGGGAGGTVRGGNLVLRDQRGVNFRNNWGSAHPGGALFLFADSSVRPLSYGVAPRTVDALLTPRGGEVVTD